jgi:hypothetical protein
MTIRLRPEVSHVESGRQTLLFDQRSGSYFAINHTAAALITQLTTGADPNDLVDTLADRYGIELDRARADVSELLVALHNNDLTVQVKQQ